MPSPTIQRAETTAPRPRHSRRTPLCRCGKPVEIRHSGSWFTDGKPRGYCLDCHMSGAARMEAAMLAMIEQERRGWCIAGKVLLSVATLWALGWVGGSDHPSEAGEPPLWHWSIITPIAIVGALLTLNNSTRKSKP